VLPIFRLDSIRDDGYREYGYHAPAAAALEVNATPVGEATSA
jgi:hypothetical protein